MDFYLAQIILFGGNFVPRGWMACNGQLLPISQYTALFSLLGTQYGGDGTTNFALPKLPPPAGVPSGSTYPAYLVPVRKPLFFSKAAGRIFTKPRCRGFQSTRADEFPFL